MSKEEHVCCKTTKNHQNTFELYVFILGVRMTACHPSLVDFETHADKEELLKDWRWAGRLTVPTDFLLSFRVVVAGVVMSIIGIMLPFIQDKIDKLEQKYPLYYNVSRISSTYSYGFFCQIAFSCIRT
jgi:hypothetical protein